MGGFGDISRMTLADIEKKRSNEEPNVSEEIKEESAGTELEVMDMNGNEAEVSDDGQEDQEAEASDGGQTDREVEVMGEPQKMAEPTGRHYYIDAEITRKEMTFFLLGHNYRQPIILLATAMAIIWPILSVIKGQKNLVYVFILALFILLYFPLSALNRGRNLKKLNPAYEKTFYYMLDEAGLHLELGEEAIDVEWKRILKVMYLKSVIVLYTGRTNAFLIPTKDMGTQKEEVIAFIKEMKKKR